MDVCLSSSLMTVLSLNTVKKHTDLSTQTRKHTHLAYADSKTHKDN